MATAPERRVDRSRSTLSYNHEIGFIPFGNQAKAILLLTEIWHGERCATKAPLVTKSSLFRLRAVQEPGT